MPDHAELESEYLPIKIPESFDSDIPTHLLTNASVQDKFIMENLSIQKNRSKFHTECLVSIDLNVRKTNGRLKRAEVTVHEHDLALEQVKTVLPMILKAQKIYDVVFGNKIVTTLVCLGVGVVFLVIYPYFLRYWFSDLIPLITKFFHGS